MFLVRSKGKYNIDAIFEIPIFSLNKNNSFIHHLNTIKDNDLVSQTTMQVT